MTKPDSVYHYHRNKQDWRDSCLTGVNEVDFHTTSWTFSVTRSHTVMR